MTEPALPERFWHCMVETSNGSLSVMNDLTFDELEKTIVVPWCAGRPFTIGGAIVRNSEQVKRIRIAYTPQSKKALAEEHDHEMHASGVADFVTDRRLLPFSRGKDLTNQLLFEDFEDQPAKSPERDLALVEQLCRRLPYAARILSTRSREGKTPFLIEDEYDVQDLLHALLRGYLRYSVQEEPLPKLAGVKSGRVDTAIEDLGTLIEIKFARTPQDQTIFFKALSQDLLLYAQWPHLRVLIYLIFNSSQLRDPEALEKLSGEHTIQDRRFRVIVILA